MKQLFLILPLVALAACGKSHVQPLTPQPVVETHDVYVPVAGPSCVPDSIKAPPAYVDSNDALKKAENAAVRYQLLWAGRSQRIARSNEVEPVIAACHKKD